MSDTEVAAFLAGERTVTCATMGPRGWPHLMPLWYVLRDSPEGDAGPRVWAWTYAASQKVRNLERDPRATLQVEAAEAYEELRGVMLECEVVIHRDLETVAPLGEAIMLRNSVARDARPPDELPSQAREAVEAQAAKRVGLEFVELRRATWDHRKLGGVY
jgi:nitroimidazol reductase NimA-like FMN-containing flavoprotein (pyridoxamine 5'-phosphate oxidase superfamily)